MKRSQNQLNQLLAISGVATFAVGTLALAGWIFGLRSLASISPEYMPMAPATTLLSAGFGLIFLSVAYKVNKGIGRSLTVGAVCYSSFAESRPWLKSWAPSRFSGFSGNYLSLLHEPQNLR